MIGVYKIVNPEGKIYIGGSNNIKRRFGEYRRLSCKKQYKLYESFLKFGVSSHIFETIFECSLEELAKFETFYGLKYNVLTKEGLNLSLPKEEFVYGGHSQETKNKIGKSRVGKKHSDKTRAKMSKSLQGRKAWNKGIKLTNKSGTTRRVINRVTNLEFESIKEASIYYNLNYNTLIKKLCGIYRNNTDLDYST